MICLTCAFTVLSDIPRASAISLFDRPSEISAKTSRWRLVSACHGRPDISRIGGVATGFAQHQGNESPARAHPLERGHQNLDSEAHRQKASGARPKDHPRALRVIAVGDCQDRRLRGCGGEERQIRDIDMPAGRGAEKNDRKSRALPQQTHQIRGRFDVGDPPSPRLLAKRELEAVAPQGARIDDREMPPSALRTRPIRPKRD